MFKQIKLFFKANKAIKAIKNALNAKGEKIEQLKLVIENLKTDLANLIIILPEIKDFAQELLGILKDLFKK